MRVKLGDICDRGSSNLMQKEIVNKSGQYPIYGASGQIGSVDFFHQDSPYVAVVKDGAGIGRTMLLPAKSSIIGTLQYLLPRPNVLPDYLCYVVQYMHLEKYFSGATIPHIYFRDYKNEEFNLVSIEEQKAIVEILNKLQGIIEKRHQQLRKLDDLAKARFVEMFGDECETVLLSEVAEVTGGLTKNSKRNQFPIKLPYLRVANVFYNSIDTSEMLEIGLTTGERDKTLLQYGDLLFVEGNGSPEQIGRVAVWRDNVVPCVHQNHLIKARFVGDKVLPEFAMYYFMTPKGREQIKRKAVSTSGLYTLSVSKVAGFTLPQPLFNQQKAFAAFAAQIDKSKEAVQQALDKTQQLFDSLMQQYFA